MTIKNSVLYNSILQVSQILFPLISFPYISRVLEPEGFGVVNFASNLSALFISLVSLGIPLYGMREIAKLRNNFQDVRKITSELLILHATYSLLGLLGYSVLVFSVGKFQENQSVFLISGLVILFSCFSIEWLYQGLERFRYIAVRTILIRALSVVALFLFVKTKSDVFIYMLIIVLTQFANGFINLLYAKRNLGFTIKGLEFKRHRKPLILLYGSSLAMAIYVQMDTVMLGLLSTEKDVGLYSATVRISKLPLAFISALSTSFIPRISLLFSQGNYDKTNRIINTSLQLLLFYSIPVSFGLFLFAEDLLLLFSGSRFIEASLSLKIVSFLTLGIGLSNLFGMQILTAVKQDDALLKSVLVGTVVNFVLNLILIPFFGFNGATAATAVAEISVTLITFVMVHRRVKFVKFDFTWFFPTVLSCLSFIAIKFFIVSEEDSFGTFFIQFALCVATYFVLQKLFRSPIMSLSNLKRMLND